MFKKILLFFIALVFTFIVVVGIFIFSNKVSKISIPTIPSVNITNLIKFSRFSLDKAPSQSLVGTLTSMSGDVVFESRIATEAAKITKTQDVQQGENLSTGEDGSLILNFKDAVEISLEKNSGINVIQTLPADLVFKQTLGSVVYKKLGVYPVSIRVGHLLIENSGEVRISFTKDSPVTTVVVIDGSAIVAYNNLNNNSRVVNLAAGQILEFNEGTRRVVTK